LLFTGCNKSSIEETKRLNQNSQKDINTQDNKTKALEIEYQNRINLENIKNQNTKDLTKLQLQKDIELAKIQADKEQRVKEIDSQIAKTTAISLNRQKEIEANASIRVATIESNTQIVTSQNRISLYKNIAIVSSIIFIIWLIFYYINKASKRRHEARLKEQELNHKAYIEETKLKHQNIEKMLEIIGDKDSDKEIKKDMSKLLVHK